MAVVRNTSMDDAGRILAIYDYYVKNTAVTCQKKAKEAKREEQNYGIVCD